LLTLLPHLQRALQLEKRLAIADRTHLGSGALDALAIAVVLVDRSMRILHANAAASRLMDGSRCGLAMLGSGPYLGVGDIRLLARHPEDQSTMVKLVANATAGGSGGAFRLRTTRDEPAQNAQLAVLVSPAMSHLSARQADRRGVTPGAAMLVVRQLNQACLPPPSLMSELYGLTKAEAEVALRFSGGATAEDVARHRQVSLDTVRTQVKAILRKTNAASLRDLERIIAISSAMLPAAS
jgi:DNA-binding CsgD family transcriptional regulator